MYFLCKGTRPNAVLKAIVEMRMMSLAGYQPDLVCCAECGCYEAETMYFLPRSGKILCGACYRPQKREPAFLLHPGRDDGAAPHGLCGIRKTVSRSVFHPTRSTSLPWLPSIMCSKRCSAVFRRSIFITRWRSPPERGFAALKGFLDRMRTYQEKRGVMSAIFRLAAVLFPENYLLCTSHEKVVSQKIPTAFDGFRIVQVSDLHGCRFGKENRRLLEKIAAEKPASSRAHRRHCRPKDTGLRTDFSFCEDALRQISRLFCLRKSRAGNAWFAAQNVSGRSACTGCADSGQQSSKSLNGMARRLLSAVFAFHCGITVGTAMANVALSFP